MKPGLVLAGKYRLEETIGEGATGVVWQAIEVGTGRAVAVKVLHPALATRDDARARFSREARVAASLHHPSAVAVLDFGECDDGIYLVMELLIGRVLRERMDAGPMSVAEACELAGQVAAALTAAHLKNLVHRDLKPENIFLQATDAGERVRVVDFGLAFIAAPLGGDAGSLGRLTDEGILGGTPAYMSPEQVRGRVVGPASDVYSLGCVLYELIAERPPFVGSVTELLTRHAYAPPLPLRQVRSEVAIDPRLDALVLSMLAKSPPLRPPAKMVAASLAAIASGTGADSPGRLRAEADDRATRMVARPDGVATATILSAPLELDAALVPVAWHGAWDEDVALALAANGLHVVRAATPARHAVVYAPGADAATLAALVATGSPIVTDAATDLARITELLRAGVAEVVTRPVRPDDLARKLHRAHRRPRT